MMSRTFTVLVLVLALALALALSEAKPSRSRTSRAARKGLRLPPKVAARLGVRDNSPDGRIVGGENVNPGEIPYQISFESTSGINPFHFCGGSILTETVMICAAHCVAGEDFDNPQDLQIVAGDDTLYGVNGQATPVTRIIQHEDYNAGTVENDISLLFISEPLVFSEFIQSVTLPTQGQQSSGDSWITGWGDTTEGGDPPSDGMLQKVKVPVVDDDTCNDAYGGDVYESMICAGVEEGGKDSCQGDSGGPMVCGFGDGPPTDGYQCGIVSWGLGCARPGYPGVYTEVSYFVDWINANMGGQK